MLDEPVCTVLSLKMLKHQWIHDKLFKNKINIHLVNFFSFTEFWDQSERRSCSSRVSVWLQFAVHARTICASIVLWLKHAMLIGPF